MSKVRNPSRFSDHFNINAGVLIKAGALDPLLNADTLLFIDPLLLVKSKTPEMETASDAWHKYFQNIIKLIEASTAPGDLAWRTAEDLLQTGEFKGTCLGYGAGTIDGRGIGQGRSRAIMATAKQLVDMGVRDPDLFSLLPLFEEGVGADLISDQTTTIIARQLAAFTIRALDGTEIDTFDFQIDDETFALPVNPFVSDRGREQPVVLVPRNILGTLPVAYGPGDIDSVASHNRRLRRRVNTEIGRSWKQYTKSDVRRAVLSSNEAFRKFLEANRLKRDEPYNVDSDPEGHVQWLERGREIAAQAPLTLQLITHDHVGMRQVVEAILKQFKKVIEDNGVWKSLYAPNGKALPEMYAQKLFFTVADSYCRANNIDVTPEANSGPGPVDFKFSSGYEVRILVEIKLSSNSKLVHGYTKQLDKYKRAEQTEAGYLLLLDNGTNAAQVADVYKHEAAAASRGALHSRIVSVDARRQASASNL